MNAWRWLTLVVVTLAVGTAFAQSWPRIKDDGIHDPRSPAVREKQEPRDALSVLAEKAPDPNVGNQVRWVKLLDMGVISPRTNLWPDTKIRVLDLDIYMDIDGSLPVVRFPHRQHTLWLDCSNCHDAIFKAEAGATPLSMLQILEGEQCGICHGAVAFPLTECGRCHSVPQADFKQLEKSLGLKRFGPKGTVAR